MMGMANWLAQSGLASRPIVQNPFMRWLAETPNPPIEVVKPNTATKMSMPKTAAPQGPTAGRMSRQGFMEQNNPTPNLGVLSPALRDNGLIQMISPNAGMI